MEKTFLDSYSGPGNLTVSSIGLGGVAAGDFTLSGLTTPATVGANLTATFQVRFNPSVAGTRTAIVTIANNDGNENPYDFAIQGAACANTLTVTNANDNSAGSLRQAITDLCDGGTINFAADTSIYLDSQLNISKTLTIDGGTHAITISGDSGHDNDRDVRVFYIDSSGVVTLTHLSIVSGTTTTYGGGIYNSNYGTLTVLNSTLSDNRATDGGGIYSSYMLTVLTSTLSGNFATDGGGIYNSSGGWLTVKNSTFSGNSATYDGGGIHHAYGPINIQNSTFFSNSATYEGGGLYNAAGTLTVKNSTFSGNSASWYGGGIYSVGTLNLINTLIANSPSDHDCGSVGTINTNDHNLIQGTGLNACGLTNGENGSLIGVDPLLAPLGDYGGSTWTLALLPGSPALNAGNNNTCLATDQRGVTRPLSSDGTCDIGAFESRGFNLIIGGGSGQRTAINTAFTNPLTLTVSSGFAEPVNGGQLVFTGPGSGAGLSNSPLTATISNGSASQLVTANGTAGSYVVTATMQGNLGSIISYNLTNTSPAPEMAVLGNDATILDGDTSPSAADHTVFGSVTISQTVTRTFTISNSGTADLAISSISLSGAGVGDFNLSNLTTPTMVGSNLTTTFQIHFTPLVVGTRMVTVTITNNDPDETPYDFAIQGTGTAAMDDNTYLPIIVK